MDVEVEIVFQILQENWVVSSMFVFLTLSLGLIVSLAISFVPNIDMNIMYLCHNQVEKAMTMYFSFSGTNY